MAIEECTMLHRNEKELCQVAYTYIHTWLCDIVASLSFASGRCSGHDFSDNAALNSLE
jgi:hypothetical protein